MGNPNRTSNIFPHSNIVLSLKFEIGLRIKPYRSNPKSFSLIMLRIKMKIESGKKTVINPVK